ncbi:FkbM family methyltransferase [Streptomyces sp. NPDC050287]|uniref:FkbM family methyltransferase n=1 Tax=Streptomyces sp. NPDC050287 TaxID=3365608 RepID=UPI0037A21083
MSRDFRNRPVSATAESRFGAVFNVNTHDMIQRYLYLFGIWEPHLTHWIQGRLRPGDTFVDVGANIGYFSVLASRKVGDSGRVVAIEASTEFHMRLMENLRANECRNVRSVNSAVSHTTQKLTFYLEQATNLGATSIVRPARSPESHFEMTAEPLPAILTDDELGDARIIKIDVEGAEASVVEGLRPVLGRLRPDAELVIEVCPDRLREQGRHVDEIIDPLLHHGFHLYRLANDYGPHTYPRAVRSPVVPLRWRAPVTDNSDLVFSRVDAERLT